MTSTEDWKKTTVSGERFVESQPSVGKDIWWLFLLLAIAAVAAIVAHKHLYIDMVPGEYGTSALEFAKSGHISSTFSSPGYEVIIGTALHFFPGTRGLTIGNLAIYLSWVTMVWVLLQQLGVTVKKSFVVGLLFVFYPDILLSINRDYETILTNLVFLVFVSAAIYLVRARTPYAADILFSVMLGLVVLCRSNMLLCLPAIWLVMWKYKLPHAAWRAAAQFAGAFAIYAVVTFAVHGAVYWPDVGSYVLFSGANEYTERAIAYDYDQTAEGSLVLALHERGIEAYHDWAKPDDVPGDNEVRNHRFTHYYTQEAIRFAEHHPKTMVKLTLLKVRDFFRPDWAIRPAGTLGGAIKLVSALALPVWIVLCLLMPQRSGDPSRLICALTIVSFIVPHLMTVTAPRFRICIDVLCFVNIAAMLIGWWAQRSERQATS
jgi:hypothetical protein